MKILIGYDGSVDADGALHDLEYAGLPAQASVMVLTVAAPWEPFGPEGRVPLGFALPAAGSREEALMDALSLAKRAAGSLARRFPGWKIKPQAAMRQPALGILEQAEAWKPDLIVLGSHGRSALGRMLLGSVSQNVLHHARCPVRITRPRIRTREGSPRLLVGVDGSGESKAAVARMAKRSWPKGTEARVLGILGLDLNPGMIGEFPGAAYAAELEGARLEALERSVAKAAEALEAAGLATTGAVESGEPRSDLIAEAKAWRADCIFLGSRGLGAVQRFLLGSVSSAVASHAPCSVEIVRAVRAVRAADRRPASRKGGRS